MDFCLEHLKINMKIALFYANWENYGEPWSTPRGFKDELISRGHDITIWNLYHANGEILPRRNIRTYSGDCFNRFNLEYKKGYRPDALLLFDYGPFDYVGCDKKFFPDIPLILESGDTPQSFRMHAQKVRKFNATFTPDYESNSLFENMGIKSKWITHWADERIFYPRNIMPKYDVVSTCGGRKYTAEIQSHLGERFNNERYFFGNEHAERLHLGKIVFQNSQFGEITRRVFEGMACRRMVLTDRLPTGTHIDDLFEENKDIVYYTDAKDAIDKINYYTSHNEERETIALNGYNKVMQHHTVSRRVSIIEDLIKEIKNDLK